MSTCPLGRKLTPSAGVSYCKFLANQLLREVIYNREHPIRLLGLGVSHAVAGGGGDDVSSEPLWRQLELKFQPWPGEIYNE